MVFAMDGVVVGNSQLESLANHEGNGNENATE